MPQSGTTLTPLARAASSRRSCDQTTSVFPPRSQRLTPEAIAGLGDGEVEVVGHGAEGHVGAGERRLHRGGFRGVDRRGLGDVPARQLVDARRRLPGRVHVGRRPSRCARRRRSGRGRRRRRCPAGPSPGSRSGRLMSRSRAQGRAAVPRRALSPARPRARRCARRRARGSPAWRAARSQSFSSAASVSAGQLEVGVGVAGGVESVLEPRTAGQAVGIEPVALHLEEAPVDAPREVRRRRPRAPARGGRPRSAAGRPSRRRRRPSRSRERSSRPFSVAFSRSATNARRCRA